jgi:hypothetical protein
MPEGTYGLQTLVGFGVVWLEADRLVEHLRRPIQVTSRHPD